MANRVGVNMLQFCSVSNSSHTQPFQIKCEVYFSKELCRSSLLCRCILHVYVLCGYTTLGLGVKPIIDSLSHLFLLTHNGLNFNLKKRLE